MGWWPWSSSNDTTNDVSTATREGIPSASSQPKRDFSLTDSQHERIFGRQKQSSGSHGDRNAQADAELDSFLRELGAHPEPSHNTTAPYPAIGGLTPPTTPQPESTTPAPPTHNESGRALHPDGSLDISPDALLPRTMSCRQAFDQAFYCQSLGGKFNDIYRYGALQDCSEQWGAFWFCMRTRQYGEKDKEEHVRDYYRGREERKKRKFGSSEDVWDVRTRAVERAFWKDPDAEEGGEVVKE